MRHSVQLLRLSLAIIQCRSKPVRALATKQRHRIPKVRRACLICDVALHPCALAVFDFPEYLAAELKIVTLLIDGI